MSFSVVIINFVCYALWYTAIHFLSEPKYSRPVTVAVEAVLFLPYFYVSTAAAGNATVLRLLLGLGILAVSVQLLHRGKWTYKLMLVFLVLLMMLLSEFLTAIITPPDLFLAGVQSGRYLYPMTYYALYLFLQAVLLAMLVIAVRNLKLRHAGYAAARESLLFFLFPLSQILLLAGLFLPISAGGMLTEPLFVLFAILLCVGADIGLAIAAVSVSRAAGLQAENAALEQKITDQAAYYSSLTAHYEQVRRLRHDLDNHLYTIRILIGSGKTQDAAQYAADLASAEKSALQEEAADI